MRSEQSVGRIIGLLFLVQVLLAPVVYTQFGLIGPVTSPDYLANAAGSALQIRIALLLLFVLGALTLAIALTALPVLRRHSERMALLFLALSIIGLATQAIESVAVRNMLSMSLEYAKANAPQELLERLGALARSTWYSAHFTNLMVGHITIFVLHGILFRFALVPRVLAAAGLTATLLSTTAATMPLLGYRFSYLMILPAALIQLALIAWLIAKGFEERQHFPRRRAERVELAGA